MPMPVTIRDTAIGAVKIIETGRIGDKRGFFSECYSKTVWEAAGFRAEFVQDNLSKSSRGVLRGLHYQILPRGMGKLVRVITGSVYDVAVDLRRGSETFGRHVGVELSEANGLSLWVPVGFAHGFLALEDDTRVYYKCTETHAPDHERSLLYSDPALGIAWPFAPTSVSEKDAAAPTLENADYNFTIDAFL